MMLSYLPISIIIAFLIINSVYSAEPDVDTDLTVQFKFDKNATLKCLRLENPTFYKSNTEEKVITNDNSKYVIKDSILTIIKLEIEDFQYNYSCKSESKGEPIVFRIEAIPSVKIEKDSKTVPEGCKTILKCEKLVGGEDDLNWSWYYNGSELKSDNSTISTSTDDNGNAVLTIKKTDMINKGDYECKLKNKYGEESAKIKLTVSNPYDSIWPFLGVLAQVLVVSVLILIFEKKFANKSKKQREIDQAQNL